MPADTRELAVATARPKQPYPGLRPFEPEEWSIFFGRESMVDDVIQRMASERMVFIHGSSGSGKSSLVRAGVLPKLARQHLRHGTPWLTCAMRPSGGPLWNLAHELARLEGRGNDLERVGELIRGFNRRGASLPEIVATLDGFAGKRLCILVDQFEELFRFERETSRDEAELFVDLIVGAIEPAADEGTEEADGQAPQGRAGTASNLHIIITMRSEFLGECARFDGLAEAFNRTQYLVPRMSREALLRAIRRPAELYGGSVTQDLAENLISDVRGREDELPLIQNGLMLMWHRASAKAGKEPVALGRENFEHTGGLAKMLSDHADSIADKATPFTGQTDAVERLFRSLTDINTEGRAIRRPQSFGRLVALCGIPAKDLNSIIDLFRADGVSFLTPYFPAKIDERTIIDISHEALIRWWNRVAEPQDGWLKREFDDGLIWRSLKVEAEEFQGNRRHLLSAAATRQRREWLANRSALWSERYGGGWEAVGDLIRTSRRAAVRRWRWIWLLALPALLTIFIVDLIVVQEAFDPPEALLGLLVGLASIPVVGLMVVFAAWLLVSYVRQFLAWLRRRPAAGTSGQHGGGRVARDRRRAGRRSPIRSWGPRLLLLLSVVLVIYFAASATIGGALGVSDEVLILLLRAVTLIVVVLSVILFVLLLFSYIRQFFGWLRRRMRRSRANSRQRAGAQTPAQ